MSRLLHFPIPHGDAGRVVPLSNLAQPTTLVALPILLSLALAVAGAGPRLPAAFAAALLGLLFVLAAAQVAGLVLHGLSRRRRFRDLALFLGLGFGFVGEPGARPAALGGAVGAARRGPRGGGDASPRAVSLRLGSARRGPRRPRRVAAVRGERRRHGPGRRLRGGGRHRPHSPHPPRGGGPRGGRRGGRIGDADVAAGRAGRAAGEGPADDVARPRAQGHAAHRPGGPAALPDLPFAGPHARRRGHGLPHAGHARGDLRLRGQRLRPGAPRNIPAPGIPHREVADPGGQEPGGTGPALAGPPRPAGGGDLPGPAPAPARRRHHHGGHPAPLRGRGQLPVHPVPHHGAASRPQPVRGRGGGDPRPGRRPPRPAAHGRARSSSPRRSSSSRGCLCSWSGRGCGR